MKDWYLHQLHLYARHDPVELFKKMYKDPAAMFKVAGVKYDEDVIRNLVKTRAENIRKSLLDEFSVMYFIDECD